MRKTKNRTLDPEYKKTREDANRARRREALLVGPAMVREWHQADCKCPSCYKLKMDRHLIYVLGEELPKISGQHLAWVLSLVISQVCERLKGDAPIDGLAEESATRFQRRVP